VREYPRVKKENSLIRPFARLLSAAALIALFVPVFQAGAQQHVPPAPDSSAQQAPAAPGQPAAEPSAPAPTAAPTFPKPDPANFTAASPTKETVNNFLTANWGFDENRVWQVQAILTTPVENVSKVVVFIGDKTGKQKPQAFAFFVMPDGKHIITGDSVVSFGDHPFAELRQRLQQSADGPYRGSASKDLELVEFADFQCPHCKEAQANMDKLAADFPKARIVFQNFPIAAIHPQSVQAAEYGLCVTKLGGSSDFFQFAAAVFDGQDGLATPDGAALTLNSAVIKAGLEPAKVSACAAAPEIKASVDASYKLGADIGINAVPTLIVNGRELPVGEVPYDVLKKIVEFQAKLDGVDSGYNPPVPPLAQQAGAGGLTESTIHDEVESIRLGAHGQIPPAQRSATSSAGVGRTTMTVNNSTAYQLTVLYDGPVPQKLTLAPGASQSLDLTPGVYHVAGRVSASNVLPFYGEETYDGSASYSETFYIGQ
jgi:protein-disulfide isomerase